MILAPAAPMVDVKVRLYDYGAISCQKLVAASFHLLRLRGQFGLEAFHTVGDSIC